MASVCPRLAARPPSWAMSGKIWPGLMKSSAVELKSAKALIVLARSFALMPDHAEHMWNAIFEAGREFGIEPAGLAARDTLRLEMGFCLYGNDINDTTSPIEAGLGWITKFTKDFNNRTVLESQKANGVERKLVGFELVDKGIPRHDYEICDADGKTIGIVTSGTMAPSLKKAIGMGYVPKALSTAGSEIFIKVREKLLSAKVVNLPFYKP